MADVWEYRISNLPRASIWSASPSTAGSCEGLCLGHIPDAGLRRSRRRVMVSRKVVEEANRPRVGRKETLTDLGAPKK